MLVYGYEIENPAVLAKFESYYDWMTYNILDPEMINTCRQEWLVRFHILGQIRVYRHFKSRKLTASTTVDEESEKRNSQRHSRG